MKHPAASGGVSGAKTAKCGTAIRLAMHRLQVPPQGAGNLPTAINGISVPPEPDATANNATLAGVDSNNNGVRDDVERNIASSVGGRSEFDSTLSVAKDYQTILTNSTITSSEVSKIHKTILCKTLNSNGLIKNNLRIKKDTANTPERLADLRSKLINAPGTMIGLEECK